MRVIDERLRFDDCEAFGPAPISPRDHVIALLWPIFLIAAVGGASFVAWWS